MAARSLFEQSERTAVATLSFYDHHRQSYGHMPIRQDGAVGEFMIGAYADQGGVKEGGEFGIWLYSLNKDQWRRDTYLSPRLNVFTDGAGSLKVFIESGAWDRVVEAGEERTLRTCDDLTAVLVEAGLRDRSDHPVGHRPICSCCGRPTDA